MPNDTGIAPSFPAHPTYELARQEGLEPPTHSLEGCRSIQLSYWRKGKAAPTLSATERH